ncbi:MAG TPA: hypothetical protein VMB48_00235 [Steroidobacteraceae bacterium]|nr:hypothetical protein [Steroidobacteraceae bacterium]
MPTPGRMLILCLALPCAAPPAAGAAPQTPPFHFEVRQGANLNYFLRDGQTAAHLVLRGGDAPRILVAFPAGDSGVGVWFRRLGTPMQWVVDLPPAATGAADAAGRPLRGIVFEVSTGATRLSPGQAVLSSIRVLRDYQGSGTLPAEVAVRPEVSAHSINWARARLDGAPGYRLTLQILDGSLEAGGSIAAGADRRIRLRITALTGETPLTPLAGAALLNGRQNPDRMAVDVLTFLSYREKFLAGSWRFDTYFGRDTLMAVRLLMPVLTPAAIEAALRSVLARLAPDGEVAHEESIGEFAVLSHRRQGASGDAPILDYGMIDGNYLLPPVAAAYLLDLPEGRARAAAFLRGGIGSLGAAGAAAGAGTPAGEALVRNLRLVAANASKFAAAPRFDHLIALKAGHDAGQWRDSSDGLGGGRYPYDVNAVLMPAALRAAARLLRSGVLDPYLAPGDRALLAHAGSDAELWRDRAPDFFDVRLDNSGARAAIRAYARRIGVPAGAALAALGAGALRFHAISLDGAGQPVPIVHSDEGFELLFATPAPADLDRDVRSVIRPFPLGLMTGAGMLVANPAFADAGIQARFSNHAYHGTVVWSWQQALFAIGLQRQLRRTDLPQPVRRHLLAARRRLWSAIRATRTMRNSELWSWRFTAGRYRITPFGSSGADADESNAAQLWSTVYLAVKPPPS